LYRLKIPPRRIAALFATGREDVGITHYSAASRPHRIYIGAVSGEVPGSNPGRPDRFLGGSDRGTAADSCPALASALSGQLVGVPLPIPSHDPV
jgi:hypothetical protein